jgi:hemerythrin-like metal-binding protein
MLKHGYPGAAEHKAEHDDLIASAQDLQRKLLEEGKAVSSDDIELLEHWLTGHIYGADMDMGAYLCEAM